MGVETHRGVARPMGRRRPAPPSTTICRPPAAAAPCAGPPDSEDRAQLEAEPCGDAAGTDLEKASLVVRQIDRWIASMERLRLAD